MTTPTSTDHETNQQTNHKESDRKKFHMPTVGRGCHAVGGSYVVLIAVPYGGRMDTFMGVPAHPLFVHLPVVLIPLATVGVLLMVAKPAWWERYKWATLGVAGVGMIGAILAAGTGEELEEAVEDTSSRSLLRAHVEAGEAARTISIIFFVVLALGIVVLPWWMRRRSSSEATTVSPRWLRTAVSLVLVVASLGASWGMYDAGHTGAKSVWSDVKLGSGGEKSDRGGDRDDD